MMTQFRFQLLFILISISFPSSSISASLKTPLLRNLDFESLPTNITANSTSPFLQLTNANTIPGWSHNGTVRYVSSGSSISLPGNGHAVQLGQSGKLNQTITNHNVDNNFGYVLSFILVPQSKDCFNDFTAVNVSVPGISKVFFLNGHYGKQMWETHGFYIGFGSDDEPFNLLFEKVSTDTGSNLTCDPIVDELVLRRFSSLIWYGDAIVANYGFEEGPGVTGNYSEGILLHEDPDYLSSPLQRWAILGTVKYIDSKHYKVPEGKAALELLSGEPSGISVNVGLKNDSKYSVAFTVGDAKDSCLTNFTVFARAATSTRSFNFGQKHIETTRNFTMNSNGTGSTRRYSMEFDVQSEETEISIYSFKKSKSRDGVFCGPVIDNVKIRSLAETTTSRAAQLNIHLILTFLCMVVIQSVITKWG